MEIDTKKIKVTELSKSDWQKVRRDLDFIIRITQRAKTDGCRVIISGGYASDGILGIVTRPHNDIDIQIFGRQESLPLVENILKDLGDFDINDKGMGEFYHSFLVKGSKIGADVYYIQVEGDPFEKERVVIKKDGTRTGVQRPEIETVALEGVGYEAINPTDAIVDRLYKRDVRHDKPNPKYDQDIENLRLITDPKEVKQRLEKLI